MAATPEFCSGARGPGTDKNIIDNDWRRYACMLSFCFREAVATYIACNMHCSLYGLAILLEAISHDIIVQ